MAGRTMTEGRLGQREARITLMTRVRRTQARDRTEAIASRFPKSLRDFPGLGRKRELPCWYQDLPGDHKPRNNAERNLRSEEPPPIDARVQERIHDAENGVK